MARKSRKNIEVAVETCVTAKTYNAGAYVRLSAVDRKQKGDSIENQQAIIAAFCEEHPDIIIREIYIDNGLSGQTFERPAFQNCKRFISVWAFVHRYGILYREILPVP